MPDDYSTSTALVLKLVIIGNSGVGKSSIIMRYSGEPFRKSYIYTIGVDFKLKTLLLNGKVIRLQIWDTAGQERFKTFTTSYYRGADGIIMVYDITNIGSFNAITEWLKEVDRYVNDRDVTIVLMGNKCESSDRCISWSEGQRLATEKGVLFTECSAKEGTNINEAFLEITKHMLSAQGVKERQHHHRSTVDIIATDACTPMCCFR